MSSIYLYLAVCVVYYVMVMAIGYTIEILCRWRALAVHDAENEPRMILRWPLSVTLPRIYSTSPSCMFYSIEMASLISNKT